MKYLILLFVSLQLQAQTQFSAVEILEKSIKVHDPKNRWKRLEAAFEMGIVRENATDRFFTIHLNLPQKSFMYEVKNDSLHYRQGFRDTSHHVFLNGETSVPAQLISRYELGKKRTQYLREVYEYLLLLPMRLQTDMKFLSKDVSTEEFNQQRCYKITLNYEPINENETWHFFIDQQTFVLHGYQFYLKDKSTNGEYIYTTDYEWLKGILVPKTKRWYWNKDRSFFRTDRILKVK